MSRNRCRTICRCEFFDFSTTASPVLASEPNGWIDLQRYFDERGYPKDSPSRDNHGHGVGYGFAHERNGVPFVHWVSPDRRMLSTTPERGLIREEVPRTNCEPGDEYRWRRLDCPICRTPFIGWYRFNPTSYEPHYELYDTSFFHSFNDEPGSEDDACSLTWTAEMIAAAAREYVERHPELFRP